MPEIKNPAGSFYVDSEDFKFERRDRHLVMSLGQGSGTGDPTYKSDVVYTVGANGDYPTLNEALMEISKKSPMYKNGGIKCEVRILSGTVVKSQVAVIQTDLQYVTITAEDPEVPVDSTGWTTNGLNAHDLRDGNVAFIGGENAAKLPTIGCLFRLTVKGASPTVGYFANRGSCGVILSGCGFDNFRDGVIANNEASIVIREGIAKNCDRWGIHARHNGEISARSAVLTRNGEVAIYADRIADIDAKEAIVDWSDKAVQCNNCSRVNAQRLQAHSCPGSSRGLFNSSSLSFLNADKADIADVDHGVIFNVVEGGLIEAYNTATPALPETITKFGQAPNTVTNNGIIFSNEVAKV